MSAPSVRLLLGSAPLVGFSGSRSAGPLCLAALSRLFGLVRGPVVVGCASGIDAAVRSALPSASVVSAASFGRGRGAFAARSVAVVRRVAAVGGVWVSLPGRACPAGLFPSASASACFGGRGSGSWASLALAVGLGVPAVVFLPAGVAAPAGWGFRSCGAWRGGSFWLVPAGGAAPSLFGSPQGAA